MRIITVRSVLIVAAPALLLATATLASEPVATPAAASAEAAPSPASAPAPDAKPDKVAATETTDDNPVVCKRVAVTGSRVKKEQVCRTQREWDAYSQRAKEFMRGIERGGSRQPGGESLPTGG
jgi:hypothetical protein